MGIPNNIPVGPSNGDNPNSNEHYSEIGMVETVCINLTVFVAVMGLFEANRFYKQIYLKRLQNRFKVANRVPSYPSERLFGWFFEIQKVSEEDILHMVGLDAFMCLRFIVLCYKLSLFLSFWGLVFLVPIYASATSGPDHWDRYSISNLLAGSEEMKYRLWFSAIFAYMFAAYFCQLLYAEYNNFSMRRLHFLVLSDPESQKRDDPDTPPQKYFTIMVERVPSELRSAELLRKFFDKLFPNDVYTVEVALDLSDLDRRCIERKKIRDKLESAIAHYEAKNVRPVVYVANGKRSSDITTVEGIFGDDGILEFLKKVFAPKQFGFHPIDAIKYYTDELVAINKEVEELQKTNYSMATALDKDIQHALKHRQETRAAAMFKNITAAASYVRPKQTIAAVPEKIQRQAESNSSSTSSSSSMFSTSGGFLKGSSIERVIYGKKFEGFKAAAHDIFLQMNVEDEIEAERIASLSPSKDDKFIHDSDNTVLSEHKFGDDIESSLPKNKSSIDHSNINPILRSSREIEMDNVRKANEAEMKAYINKRDNTRRPSLSQSNENIENHIERSKNNDEISSHNNAKVKSETNNNRKSKQESSIAKPMKTTRKRDSITRDVSLSDFNGSNVVAFDRAREVTKEGWQQTKLAGNGAMRGLMEVEKGFEILVLGAYYKYATTAFITFNSRVTESIAYQMLLSHDSMEINHAPNPHDIIWGNVAIPKSQITLRSYITNIGVIIGSIFWSSLVNSVNIFASLLPIPKSQQLYASAVIMLVFLLCIPWVFDFLARYYEGMKLESEVQNSIMTRYFYYQLINVYVTVGFSGNNLWSQLITILERPQTFIDVVGGKLPDVSLFFCSLLIVKICAAIPLEMIRPWQLSTIHLMGSCMDRKTTTRRDLRTGAFYSWPMLYGWIYPQLMMVLMVMTAYAVISPLLMPLCVIFFTVAYLMYKYQLLYVYINDYQSGGFMWYAVFRYSLVVMIFGSFSVLGYLALQLGDATKAGPFYFLVPLPFCIMYFGHYCNSKFKKSSMNLSYGFARELDHKYKERQAQGKRTPHDTFTKHLYRQPCLTEKAVYPEPYRNDGTYDLIRSQNTEEIIVMSDWGRSKKNRVGSISINVHELVDEGEECQPVLEQYFSELVLPLASQANEDEDRIRSSSGDFFDDHGPILPPTRSRS